MLRGNTGGTIQCIISFQLLTGLRKYGTFISVTYENQQ